MPILASASCITIPLITFYIETLSRGSEHYYLSYVIFFMSSMILFVILMISIVNFFRVSSSSYVDKFLNLQIYGFLCIISFKFCFDQYYNPSDFTENLEVLRAVFAIRRIELTLVDYIYFLVFMLSILFLMLIICLGGATVKAVYILLVPLTILFYTLSSAGQGGYVRVPYVATLSYLSSILQGSIAATIVASLLNRVDRRKE